MLGGALATPPLLFTGQPDGELMALDAKTLDKVWSFNTGSGLHASPKTFAVSRAAVGLGGARDKWFIDGTPELKPQAPAYGVPPGVTSGAILVSPLVSIVTVSALVAWL